MLRFFLEDSPGDQVIAGAVFLLAGFVVFPAMFSVIFPVVKWMNGAWYETAWMQAIWRFHRGFAIFGCSYFILLGAGRLAVLSFVKAGFMENPWS